MNLVNGIIVFCVIWWVVIFMTLPFGAQAASDPGYGHDHGAPEKSYLKIKLIATTLITIVLWFIVDYLIAIKFIDFREIANNL